MNLQTVVERARNAFWLRACDQIGHEPCLRGRPTVSAYGGHIRIGNRFRLASRPVASHLMTGPEGVIEIGHDVSIAHGAAIAAFERVQIGHGTYIGPFVIIMDTNFHGAAGDQSVQHDCRPVVIGDGCRIGTCDDYPRRFRRRWRGDSRRQRRVHRDPGCEPAPAAVAHGCWTRRRGRRADTRPRAPSLVMQSLRLDVPPDLDTGPSGVPQWDDPGVLRLLAAIERSFGVELDATRQQRAVVRRSLRAIGASQGRTELAASIGLN